MPTYDADVDAAAENNSHSLMLRLVGPDRKVLDVGCATGYLGEALMERGCRVSGVELDLEAAKRAEKVLDEVLVADLETVDLVAHFGAGSFDVVVLGDVLEHLRDPLRLLKNAVGLLAPQGSVVISIPNVTHAALRLALLQGSWTYSDRGLLDRTHVQFFTRSTLIEMVRGAGLVPVDVRSTTAPTFETEISIDRSNLPEGIVAWVESQPDSDVYQYVLRAVRDDADGVVEGLRLRNDAAQAALRGVTARLAEQIGVVERLSSDVAQLDARATAAERELEAMRARKVIRGLEVPRRLARQARRALEG